MSAPEVRSWLEAASRAITGIDSASLTEAVAALAHSHSRGGTIFIAGNGGSASTASHQALDLQKAANGVRAVSLSDNVGLITAWANDVSFERVFAEQLATLARAGDALLVYSVSGSSPNIVSALTTAREMGLTTVGVLGKDGGVARGLVDHAVCVPSEDYGWVESAHVVVEHVVTYALRAASVAARP